VPRLLLILFIKSVKYSATRIRQIYLVWDGSLLFDSGSGRNNFIFYYSIWYLSGMASQFSHCVSVQVASLVRLCSAGPDLIEVFDLLALQKRYFMIKP
jgi:hypothetical protein